MSAKQKTLFITLKTFSLTGGVEKVCRSIAYAFYQLHQQGKVSFNMLSLYDQFPDKNYINEDLFTGFEGKLISGIFTGIRKGIKADTVILSHINLAPIGLAIKLLRPKTKVMLWTHGIEVWRPINFLKKWFLKKVDHIIAVSNYTSKSLQNWHQVNPEKVKVVVNCLDPFFQIPKLKESKFLATKYHIPDQIPIFMALARLKGSEQNKNYDKVIRLLGELKKERKPAYYILCGKYDEQEYQRILRICREADMEKEVILCGFVPDEEIMDYYQSANAFVLPSTKEGFGLVFIEAQACGLQVLAGNQDGSTEAVRNEKAGMLINPANDTALKKALLVMMQSKPGIEQRIQIQESCIKDFGYERFAMDLEGLLLKCLNSGVTEIEGAAH